MGRLAPEGCRIESPNAICSGSFCAFWQKWSRRQAGGTDNSLGGRTVQQEMVETWRALHGEPLTMSLRMWSIEVCESFVVLTRIV